MKGKKARKAEDEEVGYGKPPKQFQFQKGQSGNPLGRPKMRKTNAAIVNEFLDARIKVGDKVMTKREALFVSIINDAIKGKASARNTLLALIGNEEVELEAFEETLEDKIALFEAQCVIGRREAEDQ